MLKRLLIIDDEEKLRKLLARIIQLEWEDYQIVQASNLKTGLHLLKQSEFDVLLCDVKLPDGNGVDFVLEAKKQQPLLEVLLMTAFGQIADGVQAMKNGAFDYISKGDENNRIIPLLYKAFEKVDLAKKVLRLEAQVGKKYAFDQIIGKSKVIQEAIKLGKKVATTDATVLLLGETGTGKEVFAQSIHYASQRKGKNFVAVNCAAISKELLESELFGHVAGAFTGALKDKKGLFEEANLGTVFLDEIGEMPLDLQAKLLRVLETGEFLRVGETKPIKVDIRVIAATNRDLEQESAEGNFRADLFYRLSVFTILLPSLKERKEDIPLLVNHFVDIHASKLNIPKPEVSENYINALQNWHWKGNIRELKNMIERSLILNENQHLSLDALPYDIQQGNQIERTNELQTLNAMEKNHIQKVLAQVKGNKAETARILGIGIATLYRKLDEYKLDKEIP